MGFRQYRAMVRKDLLSELRTRETVVAMFLFVVLAMVVFHYAFTVSGGGALSFYTGGMLWVVFVFGALLGLNRSFAHEKDEGVLDGLLLCPVDRVTIFFAKMTGNLIFLGLIQIVAVPVFALFFAPHGMRRQPAAVTRPDRAGRPRHRRPGHLAGHDRHADARSATCSCRSSSCRSSSRS